MKPGDTRRAREYKAYLKSSQWRAIRGAALLRADWTCSVCRATDYLHVHHKSYPEVLGTETPDMLQVLCDACHAEEHGQSYLLHKLTKERRKERWDRLRVIRDEKEKAERERSEGMARVRKRKREERWERLKTPTPSLKDRFK